MRQRILLAKALIHQPKLLFLDEPTSALDPNTTRHIHKGLLKLKESGTTIFLTTHDMDEAESLCDRIALINNGKLIALDTPDNLRYQHSDQTITNVSETSLYYLPVLFIFAMAPTFSNMGLDKNNIFMKLNNYSST